MMKDDTISRQAAIDVIMGQPPEPHYPTWYAEQIRALPSAQPETTRCMVCKWWDDSPSNTIAPEFHRCRRVGGVINMTAFDYCSRGEKDG